jgi:hypothetical protein
LATYAKVSSFTLEYTILIKGSFLTWFTDEIQLRERDYRALPRMSKRNYTSVLNYLFYGSDLQTDEEELFLCRKEAVSLAANTQNTWLDENIEKLLFRIPGSQVCKPFIFDTFDVLTTIHRNGSLIRSFEGGRLLIYRRRTIPEASWRSCQRPFPSSLQLLLWRSQSQFSRVSRKASQ